MQHYDSSISDRIACLCDVISEEYESEATWPVYTVIIDAVENLLVRLVSLETKYFKQQWHKWLKNKKIKNKKQE